jgi:hypothetical protein
MVVVVVVVVVVVARVVVVHRGRVRYLTAGQLLYPPPAAATPIQ